MGECLVGSLGSAHILSFRSHGQARAARECTQGLHAWTDPITPSTTRLTREGTHFSVVRSYQKVLRGDNMYCVCAFRWSACAVGNIFVFSGPSRNGRQPGPQFSDAAYIGAISGCQADSLVSCLGLLAIHTPQKPPPLGMAIAGVQQGSYDPGAPLSWTGCRLWRAPNLETQVAAALFGHFAVAVPARRAGAMARG